MPRRLPHSALPSLLDLSGASPLLLSHTLLLSFSWQLLLPRFVFAAYLCMAFLPPWHLVS